MIYLWQCERKQFVDYVSSRTPVSRSSVRQSKDIDDVRVSGDEIVLVWKSSPTKRFSFPHATIVDEEKIQDFLAWVSTYFRNIRPFTAHCRVESPASARLAASSNSTDWPRNNRSVDLGLILTEAVAYSVGHMDINRLPFSAFTRALSFAHAKAVRNFETAISGDPNYLSNLQQGWLLCRELAAQPPLDLRPNQVTEVWKSVLSIDSKNGGRDADSIIVKGLCELRDLGHITKELWRKLIPEELEADVLWQAMEGPREGRVLAVEKATQILVRGTTKTQQRRAFTAGYLASRVQPGTLDHLSLLFPFVTELRESLLWFGACAGLSPETTVDNYGNGLGWLMRRELGRQVHWLDRPSCDISISELKMLLQDRDLGRPEFPTTASGVLQVEILPLINTNIRWSAHPEEQTDRETGAKQRSLFMEDTRLAMEVTDILRRVEESSASLQAIRHHVERTFGRNMGNGRSRRK